MKLQEFNSLPKGLLEASPKELNSLLGGPSLIHLEGKKSPALFISILLHGNETTGFYALKRLLKSYEKKSLGRSLSIFIGNVKAAEKGLRKLEGQQDFNRIWPGTTLPASEERTLAEEVFQKMRSRGIFASVDIHNNTGDNPHYACLNSTTSPFLHLAGLFSDLVVYYLYPKGVQSFAFAQLAPSVTLECGLPQEEGGVEHATEFLEKCLRLESFSEKESPENLHLFHTIGTVTVPSGLEFSFGDETPLSLLKEIEHYNFKELDPGTVFAKVTSEQKSSFEVKDEFGNIVTSDFFQKTGNLICLKKKIMPAMITLNKRIIREDCLCYFMERYAVTGLYTKESNRKSLQ